MLDEFCVAGEREMRRFAALLRMLELENREREHASVPSCC